MFQYAGDECPATLIIQFAFPGFKTLNHPGERIVEFPGVIFMSRTVRVVIIDVLSKGQMHSGQSQDKLKLDHLHWRGTCPIEARKTTHGIPSSDQFNPG